MQELISRTAQGDRKALGKLYEANMGLIRKVAAGYAAMCERDIAVAVDDLEQVAFFAVAEAAVSYDPAAGKSWAGWLVYFLRRQMNQALGRRNGRFLRPDRDAVSLDAPLLEDDADGGSMLDLMADDALQASDEAAIEAEIVQGVRAAVQRIQDSRQRYVIAEIELKGRSSREVAEELGVTIAVVNGDRGRAFKVLRRDRELIELRKAHCIDPMAYFRYKSVHGFEIDWTSVTEGAALWGASTGSEQAIE